MLLAIAILLSTILYLIDKNQAWSSFWKVTKRGVAAIVVIAVLSGVVMYFYQRHESAKAMEQKWAQFEVDPPAKK